MSSSVQESVICPKCKHRQDFTYWTTLNVTVDPSLKSQLLDRRLTTFKCEICRHEVRMAYDMLYHDMRKPLAIWLKWPDEDGTFGVYKPAADYFAAIAPNHICRVVPSFEELVEKVQIFDDGYDDLEIELFKYLICVRQGIDITHPLYYAGTKRPLMIFPKQILFVSPVGGSLVDMHFPFDKHFPMPPDILKRLSGGLAVDSDRWLYLNRESVSALLQKAGLARRIL